jgi:O-methyltransferase
MNKTTPAAIYRTIRRVLNGKRDDGVVVPMDAINTARLLYFRSLLEQTRAVPGDIVECGVGHGRSLLTMSLLVKIEGDKRNLWAFDSFQGFPTPTSEDVSPRDPQRGQYSISLPFVTRTLERHLADEQFVRSRVTLVKGFFEDTLSRYPHSAISLLNLDVDLYQSYKSCLEFFWPKISIGGIVTFDEFVRESHAFPGGEQAIREFFADKQIEFQRDPSYGKYYVVRVSGS